MTDPALERRALSLFEAMLDIAETERREWLEAQTAGEAPLRRRVTAIWEAQRRLDLATGGFPAHDVLSGPEPPERIGAYRITGVIGTGGMGTVFAARRDAGDFEHEVAIKLIKPGIFTHTLVDRFNRERQILARLAHPHIARLFDGGTTEEGQPYIVMERVDGEPLADWLERAPRALDMRLRLFLQVCSAAGHAHRNLVVHRDLTPANVLVDAAGEAKLIDFGIARPEGEEETPLAQGAPLRAATLTPGYAAPERLRGEAATVSGDIFSAGRMLEAMTPAPRPAELSAIIAKATADAPEARYLSIDGLADDVRAFLEDRPVAAMQGGPRYHASKWLARNRALASVGAALAVALLVGSAATGWWWREAVVARDEANARFAEVRGIAGFMLFDLYDQLEPVQGNTKALARIADEARTYLERLAAGDDLDEELRLEIARGYHRLSTVSGNPEGSNLGRREDAKLLLSRALEELEALHAGDPANPDYAKALAEALYSQAIFRFIAEDDNEGAIAPAERSAQLLEELARRAPEDPAYRLAAYRSRLQAAKPYVWLDRGEVGVERMDALIRRMKADPAIAKGPPEAQIALAAAQSELAYTLSWTYPDHPAQGERAVRALDEALAIYTERFEHGPPERRNDLRLAMISALFNRSLVQYDLARPAAALADIELAETHAGHLVARDPDDEGARQRLGTLHSQKVFVLLDLGRRDEAVALARSLFERRKALLAREPENSGYARDVATVEQSLGDALWEAGRRGEACSTYAAVRARWDRIEAKGGISGIDRSNSIEPLAQSLARCRA